MTPGGKQEVCMYQDAGAGVRSSKGRIVIKDKHLDKDKPDNVFVFTRYSIFLRANDSGSPSRLEKVKPLIKYSKTTEHTYL